MEYVCKFADESGQVQENLENAVSEGEIRERYAKMGLLVYSVRPRGGLNRILTGQMSVGAKKLKLEQFLIFNQQFVTLIRAGLPILKGLELLTGRVAHPELRAHISAVRDRVRQGVLLSKAFEDEGIFPKIYVTSVMAGEKSGSLEEVLDRYIGYQRVALAVRKKVIASLIYPCVLVTLVGCLMTFLTTYVVPKFADLYAGLGADLPPMTKIMMDIGITLRDYLPLAVLLVVGAIIGVVAWSRSAGGARILDNVKMNTPLLGEIWVKYQVAQFARMLSTLLTGGIPLVQALETVGDSFDTHLIREAMKIATKTVSEGRTLSSAMAQTKIMPGLAVEMVEVGESTGALSQMLNSVAEFFEQDVETSMQAVMALIEPAIMIIVSVVVAFVLISLYMPIFSLAGRMH
jgi:type IV pilus assembly protein PilC